MTIRIELLSIGAPSTLRTASGQEYVSSIDRTPATGPVRLGRLGFDGNSCSYEGHHGPEMVVNVYCLENYPWFEGLLGRAIPRPAFGENFTLTGFTETEARIGDTLRAGGAIMQVSQPRGPCGNIVRFHNAPKAVKWIEEAGTTGYYLRVLEPGVIETGMELELIGRGDPRWTIARLNRIRYHGEHDAAEIEALRVHPALSKEWLHGLEQRILDRAKMAESAGGN